MSEDALHVECRPCEAGALPLPLTQETGPELKEKREEEGFYTRHFVHLSLRGVPPESGTLIDSVVEDLHAKWVRQFHKIICRMYMQGTSSSRRPLRKVPSGLCVASAVISYS